MGTRKGLLPWAGEPLLRAHVLRAREVGLDVRVVLGPDLAAHLAVLPPGVGWVWNARHAHSEMLDSVSLGLDGLRDAIVTPVDVPPVRAATLAALLAVEGDAVPTWEGRDGHPVRVVAPTGAHPRVRLDLRLQDARRVPVDDPGVCANLNTPADLAVWQARLTGRAAPP